MQSIPTMFKLLLHILEHANPAVRIVALLLTGGTVAYLYHWVPLIARRLLVQCWTKLGVWLSRHEAHGRGHSSANDAHKSSPSTRTPKRNPAMWSYSDAMAAGISGSLSESQKMDVLNAWKQIHRAGSVAVSGTATGCGDVSVTYTNRGQRSESLTSFGPEREN